MYIKTEEVLPHTPDKLLRNKVAYLHAHVSSTHIQVLMFICGYEDEYAYAYICIYVYANISRKVR